MKTNCKHQVLARIARRSPLLALLIAMALSAAIVSFAQSSAPSASPQDAKPTAGTAAPAQKPASIAMPPAIPATAPASPAEKSPAKGKQEGIKVHGHWTIEVKNPDGSVEKHLEFENGICPSQVLPRASGGTRVFIGQTVFGGALAFGAVASGQATFGAWEIVLGDNTALNSTPNVPLGCAMPTLSSPPNIFAGTTIVLLQNNATASAVLPNGCSAPGCFATLSAPPNPTSTLPTISLGGQFTATAAGNVNLVSTANFMCGDSSVSPASCLGAGAVLPNAAVLTGTQLPDPGVPYSGGQTVSANVVISFQ